LEKLKEKRIPTKILKSLDKLKNKSYESEAQLLETVEALIGAEAVQLREFRGNAGNSGNSGNWEFREFRGHNT
jgi:hypothetical protein